MKETLIQQIMRGEAEWGSAAKFLEEQYQTDDVDVLQLMCDTLLEHKACLDMVLYNLFKIYAQAYILHKFNAFNANLTYICVYQRWHLVPGCYWENRQNCISSKEL